MEPLRRDDIALALAAARGVAGRARATALDAVDTGIRLKRAALRARAPNVTEEEIDAQLQRWLERDE